MYCQLGSQLGCGVFFLDQSPCSCSGRRSEIGGGPGGVAEDQPGAAAGGRWGDDWRRVGL